MDRPLTDRAVTHQRAGTTRACAGKDDPPQPEPRRPEVEKPLDVPYPGHLRLTIDATDIVRGIISGRLTLPIAGPGPMTLLYPKWMPGYHSPQNPIELFAGLRIEGGGRTLDWRRDPVEVYAFHVVVPDGVDTLDISFQFLSPTTASQGDVVVTEDLVNLQWGRMLLYPAGHFSRQIIVEPALKLPEGWNFATALETGDRNSREVRFHPVPLDVLVDSPVMAGRHSSHIALDGAEAVWFDLFGHNASDLDVTSEQTDLHRALVDQADTLFASRHFDNYHFLVALSEELGGGGVEHHRSAEIVAPPTYFSEWERNLTKRDVFAHEFVHSWNGKFRRGADSWTPSFEQPIRSSLMWLYEGQTQYWGQVLTARAGLWSTDTALQTLAKVAAACDVRPGGLWRTMADTMLDPVIASRATLPWPSWQRNEDYYSEGQLLWLAVDTLIRERSGDRRSLDDFARSFFGVEDGRTSTKTYGFDDVVSALDRVVAHDWAGLLTHKLRSREPGAPLEGLERGGYRLVYRDYRNDFCKSFDALAGQIDLRFSIGLIVTTDGTIQEVMWGGPAFEAGLTSGALIRTVNGRAYIEKALVDAIDSAREGTPIRLGIRARPESREREMVVDYRGGHKFPHLEPIPGARRRLDEIFAAR